LLSDALEHWHRASKQSAQHGPKAMSPLSSHALENWYRSISCLVDVIVRVQRSRSVAAVFRFHFQRKCRFFVFLKCRVISTFPFSN
jgi:hypothetical protein